MTNYEIISLIKELKIQIESLRESLTNLTTPPIEPDPKKDPQLQSNETEDSPNNKH